MHVIYQNILVKAVLRHEVLLVIAQATPPCLLNCALSSLKEITACLFSFVALVMRGMYLLTFSFLILLCVCVCVYLGQECWAVCLQVSQLMES